MAEPAAPSLAAEGYAVLRGFLSGAALAEARAIADRARPIARRTSGLDAQRLHPLAKNLPRADCERLAALIDVERLTAAARRHVQPDATPDMERLGLWLEPATRSYCLPWHRDLRDNGKGFDFESWYDHLADPRFYNQFHLALRDDDSFWVVASSHKRDDTPAERAMFPHRPIVVDFVDLDLDPWYDRPDKHDAGGWGDRIRRRLDRVNSGMLGRPAGPWHRRRNAATIARALDYCRRLPGATPVPLQAGDLLFYRNSGWHTGVYRADRPRATLFANVMTPAFSHWLDRQLALVRSRGAAAEWFDPRRRAPAAAPAPAL